MSCTVLVTRYGPQSVASATGQTYTLTSMCGKFPREIMNWSFWIIPTVLVLTRGIPAANIGKQIREISHISAESLEWNCAAGISHTWGGLNLSLPSDRALLLCIAVRHRCSVVIAIIRQRSLTLRRTILDLTNEDRGTIGVCAALDFLFSNNRLKNYDAPRIIKKPSREIEKVRSTWKEIILGFRGKNPTLVNRGNLPSSF